MNYHCAKFYANILKNVDTTNIFPFFAIFSQIFTIFTPKMASFGPIRLGIIAYIGSWIMNHQYAKFHVPLSKS